MRKYSVFDIIGPIMIGPSSSHTAGAARLGKIAKVIAGGKIKAVKFMLHGSFANTYRGHGTDRALAAGILGMNPWDERLRDSLKIAEESGLDIEFIETDLGDVHPNSVKFIITKYNGENIEIVGSSIGGGNIVITEVDGEQIEFTGNYPTLIINHKDVLGVVNNVTRILFQEKVNIAFMKVYRSGKGSNASMVLEVDSELSKDTISKILEISDIFKARFINPVKEGE